MTRLTRLLGASLLAGVCVPAWAQLPAGLPPSAVILVRFDTNKDGEISKEEMEAGLQAEYQAADLDKNNCLNAAEVRAENERRLAREGGQATPLADWNLDGCVRMQEFAGTARSYFAFADRTKNGIVTETELRGPAMPQAQPMAEPRSRNQQGQQGQAAAPPTRPGVSY